MCLLTKISKFWRLLSLWANKLEIRKLNLQLFAANFVLISDKISSNISTILRSSNKQEKRKLNFVIPLCLIPTNFLPITFEQSDYNIFLFRTEIWHHFQIFKGLIFFILKFSDEQGIMKLNLAIPLWLHFQLIFYLLLPNN